MGLTTPMESGSGSGKSAEARLDLDGKAAGARDQLEFGAGLNSFFMQNPEPGIVVVGIVMKRDHSLGLDLRSELQRLGYR